VKNIPRCGREHNGFHCLLFPGHRGAHQGQTELELPVDRPMRIVLPAGWNPKVRRMLLHVWRVDPAGKVLSSSDHTTEPTKIAAPPCRPVDEKRPGYLKEHASYRRRYEAARS
jgi:hypothetical protein